jgi:N-methylhydantoinase A
MPAKSPPNSECVSCSCRDNAEALSALGMLLADSVRDYAAGVLGRSEIDFRFRELDRQARSQSPGASVERMADLRYAGQSYELTVPWSSRSAAEARFHQEHRRVYGYSDEKRSVEVVTIRVRARRSNVKPAISPLLRSRLRVPEQRRIWVGGRLRRVPVWRREQIRTRARPGPALVLDYGATTLVPLRWNFRTDRLGNLVLTQSG